MNYGCVPDAAPIAPVTCATGILCNELAENVATAAGGAVVRLGSDSSTVVNRVAMRRNQARNVIAFVADQSPISGTDDYLRSTKAFWPTTQRPTASSRQPAAHRALG